MASNPCPGQAGGIPKLTSTNFKPVDCIVKSAPKGVSTWNVPTRRQVILTRYQCNQSSQVTNTLGAKEGKKVIAKKRQLAALTNYRDTLQHPAKEKG